MFGFGNKKKPEKMKKRRSTIKNLGQKHNELDTEEQRELHRLGEYKRAEVEMPGIRQRRREERYQLLKPRIRRSRRRTPTNRTKRNTSLKSLRGEEDKYYDYHRNREDDDIDIDIDMRPRNKYGHLIIPPSPPPTVRMRIDDFEKASQGLEIIWAERTRKRRRKRRRKTKRKGRRKTKKRRKMRKRKTRRKR